VVSLLAKLINKDFIHEFILWQMNILKMIQALWNAKIL